MIEYKLLNNIQKYCSTTGKLCIGLFYIYVNYESNIVYKKCRSRNLSRILLNKSNFLRYKYLIENSHKINVMKKYIIPGFDVERDGSYKCKFINGIRLDRIPTNLDQDIKTKIVYQLNEFLKDINKSRNLNGDWALHNLIYDINNDKIYNIDLEGFFTYQRLPYTGNLNNINNWIKKLINNLN